MYSLHFQTAALLVPSLAQLLVFYILVLVGFAALWLTWRSNTRIRRLRQEVGTVLRQQRTTAFEAQDAKMFF